MNNNNNNNNNQSLHFINDIVRIKEIFEFRARFVLCGYDTAKRGAGAIHGQTRFQKRVPLAQRGATSRLGHQQRRVHVGKHTSTSWPEVSYIV